MSPSSIIIIVAERPFLALTAMIVLSLASYLFAMNRVLSSTPDKVHRLSSHRWTDDELLQTYRRLKATPITTKSYSSRLPPRLERRYIVTGGSGLVGGYIVLQLLERGQAPKSIRIVDLQAPHRSDMRGGSAAEVEFIQTDISSAESTDAAFLAAWHPSVEHLPLTIFHTAAVIVPSERSMLVYDFCDAINVRGTEHVLDAARRVGADILISTSSGSISIRPVGLWLSPWQLLCARKEGCWPRDFWQVLDERDFFEPLRKHEDFFANYPASKAAAERIVTGANCETLRTGCVRPANGVYGNPTDNTVGGPLNRGTYPAWSDHVIQSFVHAVNAAIAHLQFEAILQSPHSAHLPQAGRPFTVTDPNPPITYGDLYHLLATLAITPFRTVLLQPLPMLLIAYIIEWYCLILVRYPATRLFLPPVSGDIKHLKPPLFSITTHLVASNEQSGKPVEQGGLGYTGILTTLEGMVQEVVEWNREHADATGRRKVYQSSVSMAEELQRAWGGGIRCHGANGTGSRMRERGENPGFIL